MKRNKMLTSLITTALLLPLLINHAATAHSLNRFNDSSVEESKASDNGAVKNDLIIDFGDTYGLWLKMNNSNWVQLHNLSADSMITANLDGNDQDEIIIDFGETYGIWAWMNNSDWVQLHSLSPESMVTGDIDGNGEDEIIIDFGTQYAIWVWMNNSDWVQLHSLSPESMVTGDIDGNGEDEIIIDFGTQYAIWVWMNNSDWVQLHSLSPESMVTGDIDSSGQDDVIIDFGESNGILARMNNDSWVKLHSSSAEGMVTGSVHNADNLSIAINNDDVSPNEEVRVNVTGELSGNQDWVGIYPAGASNSWNNVIAWNWISDATRSNLGLSKILKDMPAGEYEARLFFNNSYEVEASVSFSVKNYSSLGPYTPIRYPEIGLHDNYVVYYPEEGITSDMPVVLFLEGGGNSEIDDYRGIMKFMASKGYFVIGSEGGQDYNSNYSKDILDGAINTARDAHGLTVAKLAVMGHSQGGGQAFYVMKSFLDQGYGNAGSLVLSIDGWFAFDMLQASMGTLNTKVSFIQMNGLQGTGTDPRIHLSLYNLADNSSKSFLTLPQDEHGYVKDSLQGMLDNKRDILHLVGALTDDAFSGSNEGYNSIPNENKATYDEVYNALDDDYSYDCAGETAGANDYFPVYGNNINYCTPEAYQ
ncbi:hypothetical protein PN36_34320 [Candidatus Thiomargarita nelsonii]|uniref:Uncharacterized protein n=1 Tax=Candidatus Thiomargarita nelsonii TaxID=1003181 RepID=A0A4E0QJ60_9GAMM|nr:hypothetical protein PN36_34320 [Candidatus Thiomargarita nelsonii]